MKKSAVKKLVVLISGSGSNLQAIIEACAAGGALHDKYEIVLVLSNRATAFGLQRAAALGIPTQTFSLKSFQEKVHVIDQDKKLSPARIEFDLAVANAIHATGADIVMLAGWMHIWSEAGLKAAGLNTISAKNVPILNLHPALPNQFAGLHAIERGYTAYRAGKVNELGCMVHEVIAEVDAGQVVDTQIVTVAAGDTLDDFAANMHAAEHTLIVRALALAHAQYF